MPKKERPPAAATRPFDPGIIAAASATLQASIIGWILGLTGRVRLAIVKAVRYLPTSHCGG